MTLVFLGDKYSEKLITIIDQMINPVWIYSEKPINNIKKHKLITSEISSYDFNINRVHKIEYNLKLLIDTLKNLDKIFIDEPELNEDRLRSYCNKKFTIVNIGNKK